MRLAGKINNQKHAEILHNYLYVNGIDHNMEQVIDVSGQPVWAIWVHADEKLDQAKRFINEFILNPDGAIYTESVRKAVDKSRQEEAEIKEYQKKMFDKRRTFSPLNKGVLTGFLIIFSIIVTLFINFGENLAARNLFSFSRIYFDEISGFTSNKDMPEIMNGEVWRLITPIFIHFSYLHIIFNMMWLYDLGRAIEKRHGTLMFGIMVGIFGVLSNSGQYFLDYGRYFVAGSGFGGMSGVVYGLLGYLWLRGKTDPFYELHLHPTTVSMMIIWFFLCLFGFLGNIANTAHAVGLITGMLTGYITGYIAKKNRFSR